MSGIAIVSHDSVMAATEDPHGLRARMAVLGLLNTDLAERLGIAPNTVTRAIGTTKRSDARPRIEALLTQLELEQQAAAPATTASLPTPRKLEQLVGDSRLVDVRIEYIGDGKIQRLVALLVDADLSREQIEQEVREWRRGHETRE